MKVTVGQFKVKSKDIKHNYLAMKELITLAKEDDYDLIVFGEYALVGYGCGEHFRQASFYEEVEYYTNKLKELSDDISIVFGSIKHENSNFYVTATILSKQNIYYSYKNKLGKRELNEHRYFHSKKNEVVYINNEKVLITFKSDLKNVYEFDYDKLITLDSSPVNMVEYLNYDIIYANTIGITNVSKVVFINGGNSYIKQNNKTYAFSNALQSGVINSENKVKHISKLDALVHGIKSFSDDNFGKNKKWLLGSSGGLDSAVTLSLLAIALGSENVISYNIRSKYNSDKTINNAKKLAEKLNVKHYEGSIEKEVNAYLETLKEFGYDEVSTLTYENIQARTRGHFLGGFSSIENAVICNNGNKMEYMLGYATLYGDTIGALAVIGDLIKAEVFDLARSINEYLDDEVIPSNLIPNIIDEDDEVSLTFETYPSAELKNAQTDPMKWMYHDLLLDLVFKHSYSEILEMYLTNQFENLEISKWLKYYDLDKPQAFIDDLNWFMRTISINSFKRIQMPPVLAYTEQLINVDYDETILLKDKSDYDIKLEAEIVNKYN